MPIQSVIHFWLAGHSFTDRGRDWCLFSKPIWVSAEKRGLGTECVMWPGCSAAVGGWRPSLWCSGITVSRTGSALGSSWSGCTYLCNGSRSLWQCIWQMSIMLDTCSDRDRARENGSLDIWMRVLVVCCKGWRGWRGCRGGRL
ncbi:hypothetical protein BC830DRAFT_813551 [Chytriomyces sp. MP71]|nr:hypothetical protein BC830DRAFT_813551 [Chytriomyces sp. MP71]